MVKRLLISLAFGAAVISLSAPVPAYGDEIFYPADYGATYNGYKIYVSPAEHGGANVGCDGFVEDYNMRLISRRLVDNVSLGAGSLVDRGYRVRLGTGNVSQNINSSNSWVPNRHIALHSNAGGSGSCPGRSAGEGTLAFYQPGRPLSNELANGLGERVGNISPGNGDGSPPGGQYVELNSTDAVAVLLEMEFHTWMGGVNWMRGNREAIAYAVRVAIDVHLDYP